MSTSYRLKQIYYLGRSVKIICQNENGPCPLIALCNILLLSGHATIHPDYGEVTLDSVIQMVANRILEYSAGSQDNSEDVKLMQQQRVNEVISILPNLQYGLDVNVKFDSVSSFEYTRELDCFDAAGVPIYHGWILDPQDQRTASVIQGMSYNLVIFRLVESRALADELKARKRAESHTSPSDAGGPVIEETHLHSSPSPSAPPLDTALTPSQQKLLSDGHIIQAFLSDTASQLTYMGLMGLYDSVGEGVSIKQSFLLVSSMSCGYVCAVCLSVYRCLNLCLCMLLMKSIYFVELLNDAYWCGTGTLCAFFRNNHFSTMLKRGGKLYLLVTDTGYAAEPSVVWELLDEIDK